MHVRSATVGKHKRRGGVLQAPIGQQWRFSMLRSPRVDGDGELKPAHLQPLS